MDLAFIVYKYFPFGGLQKDMLAIARACHDRGHRVTVYARQWQGEKPDYIAVQEIPTKGLGNHVRDRRFAEQALARARTHELVVGFNKMPGLDVYYAADSCYAAKVKEERGLLSRIGPRYRHYLRYEQAVYQGKTELLMISASEIEVFQRYYGTAPERFHLLPPGIRRDRLMPDDYTLQRDYLRSQWGLGADDKLLLFVGSGFRTKGLDRAIDGLAALPVAERRRARLFIIGQDNEQPFASQASRLGVDSQVRFLGGRDDIPAFLWGADCLVHPAYRENTGTVLLEAMVAGLPVLTTDACGYAHYVSDEGMGEVIRSPFDAQQFSRALSALAFYGAEDWRARGRDFAARADIFDMPAQAVSVIEQQGAVRHA